MGWTRFFRRATWDDERRLEIEAHLAIEIDENIARGMLPDDARLAAQRKFGNVTLVREQIDRLHAQELLFARLSGFFGLLALALACVGLYGLMSYAVLRRTAESSLRMALGALPSHVMRMMLRESVALVSLGIVAGVAAAYGLSRLVASMLFGLSPTDPLTYAAMAAVLMAVATAASGLPAVRASRLEPTAALRQE